MRLEDLDIRELLDVDAEEGVVRFAGQRALILDAVAMGLLRKAVLDTFGMTAARAVLTRFAFAHGWRMAEALCSGFTWERTEDWRNAGGVIHRLQGLIRLVPGAEDPFAPGGARLEASYEAEQHRLHAGRAEAPVCWTLTGFASGYLSRTEGQPIYVLEDACLGRGDAECRFRARTREEWGAELEPHLPFFESDGLDAVLRRVAGELKRKEKRLEVRRKELARGGGAGMDASGIVACSAAMRRVLELTRRVAEVDSTVLILGESGVGKERVARLIHEASPRASEPFLAVNCAALSETLLDSELFGHARGAFTGAVRERPGLLEAAGGGTLFLDEVGELAPSVQAKLLRALQERQVRRVGENKSRPIHVRVVAATHRDLAREVEAGRFRKDLYYRLRVVELRVPPLRERREDVLPLARALLGAAAGRMGRPEPSLTPRAADQLVRYDWPGNVRELENALERAVALARGRRIDLEDLPGDVREALPVPAVAGGVRPLEAVERDYILAALERNDGNQTVTARQLGIGAATLYRKLKQYGALAKDRGRTG
ncbi:sigma-54-dependent Fis family transcriptional regulator [Pyxidicoccus fallax]|uniref:Sigma-54-dependent Fis family transcriptional regulator n=1 Tax=Pyxidicoccus fallax TaxID=394095 RepID=A0A848LMK5_9BACT|nr:sigma-54-dependent Fis family transcriptional regulator [Pyxidicoccus fallax]NMO19065.1 sigma-54-dependent Fis family transcriptional regulator [Pyxidicoccus fallax]NPC82124.1 sigma-54-dependent Fis family transcriptional regulator [Pyxidicoccus fallax]